MAKVGKMNGRGEERTTCDGVVTAFCYIHSYSISWRKGTVQPCYDSKSCDIKIYSQDPNTGLNSDTNSTHQ